MVDYSTVSRVVNSGHLCKSVGCRKIKKLINLKLPTGWTDYSKENPNGPPTYLRDLSDEPGPLKISVAEFKSGTEPNPSKDDLIQLSKNTGQAQDPRELLETNSGKCNFGIFGTTVFKDDENSRIQI